MRLRLKQTLQEGSKVAKIEEVEVIELEREECSLVVSLAASLEDIER